MIDEWVVMGMPDGYHDVVFLTKFGCLPMALLDTPHIPGVTNLIDNRAWTRRVWSKYPNWAKRFSKAGATEMKKFLAESYRDRGERRVVELWQHSNGWMFIAVRSGPYSHKQFADAACAVSNRNRRPTRHFEVWDQETVDHALIEQALTKDGSGT